MAHIFGSIWDRFNRNALNALSKSVEMQGKTIQDLVAEGQLTPTQYAELLQTINGLISKGNVTFDDIDINQGKLLPKHASEELLRMMTGDAPVNAVPADGTVTRIKLANKAASPDKTNFIKVPNNLINKRDVIENKTIDTATGQLVDDPNYVVTDFIPTEFKTSYTRKNTSRFFAYRPDKTFLSSNSSTTYETAVNGAFLRFSIAKADLNTAQVNKGTNLQAYDEYVFELGDKDKMPFFMTLPEKSVGKNELKEKSVEPINTTFINISSNLFDKSTALLNKGGNSTTGEIYDVNNNYVSQLIEVIPSEIYTKDKLSRWLVYRHDGSFMTSSVADSYTIPEGAAHVRVNGLMSELNQAQIVKGSEKLPYKAYGAKIDVNLLPGKQSAATKDWMNERNYHIDGKVDGIYKSSELAAKGTGTNKPLTSYSVSDYYADYDAMMAKYPDYITKTLLGYDASGEFPIYRYDFIPPRPQNHGYFSDVTLPKAVLVSGSHPERMGIWCLFKTMESIAERWKEDEFLGALHNNLHFIVVPLWSPWNVENSKRWNSNLVNVGRNFPELFVTLPEEDSKYGGTEPLSEPESQYLHKILTEEDDILFHIDFHNFFGTNGYLWTDTKSAAMGRLGDQHIYKMTGEWKKRYPQIPQEHSHYVGYTTIKGDPNGHNCAFAESIGIRSVTYEVGEAVYFEEGQPRYSSMAVTLGTEAFTNYLLSIFKYTVNEKNGYK